MRLITTPGRRTGATLVEGVLVLLVLLILVVGMLDLGVAIFRQHQLDYAARGACRAATVRGSEASVLGVWGPTAVGPVAASSTGSIPTEVRSHLCSLSPSAVTVRVEWPDGDNEPGSRVTVSLETSYQPALTALFGAGPIPLKASSTMPISH
jgi:hypothetical protein